MSKKWVKDVNYWIVGKGNLHWNSPLIPGNKKPANRMPGQLHHMYRINLSHNILMNMFRDGSDPNGSSPHLRLSFKDYYGGTPQNPRNIASVLSFFRQRLNNVPTDESGKDAFPSDSIAFFASRLDAAIQVAPDLPMSALYLDTPDPDGRLALVIQNLAEVKSSILWICMPFLSYLDDPSISRPDPNDLRIHIEGNINDEKVPELQRQLGFGNWDYLDFLFYSPKTKVEAAQYHNAVQFAKSKYFIDPNDVVTHALAHNTILSSDKSILGGGNGYKCKKDSNGYKIGCEVGAATDYCVNNGSQFC